MPIGPEAFRGKILRAITIELPQADLRTYDPERAAATVADAHANLAIVFALGYLEAESYYPSSLARPRDDLGEGDPFGLTVAACRRKGLAVLAYVNTLWAGPHIYEKHPDWAQRRVDGSLTRQGQAVAICPTSPYVVGLEAIVAEIGSRYDVDGFFFDEPSIQSWCSCPGCRKGFQEQTGNELPTRANWRSAVWRQFLEWRFGVVRVFIERLHAAARRANPDYVVFSQYHFPMATPALEYRRQRWGGAGRIPPQMDDWYRPTYYGERLQDYLPSEDLAGTEVYWHSVDKPIWWGGAATNLCRLAAGGRPVLVLTEYPQLPWALTSLSPVDLQVTIADIVAAGGGPWFAWYGPGVGDDRGLRDVGELFRRLAAAGAALDGLQPAAEVALLHSRRTMDYYGRGRVRERALDEVLGVYKALLEHQIPVAVISDEHLTPDGLSPYRVLALPNAACLTQEAKSAIARFVAEGGGLVATFESGLYDGEGLPSGGGLLDRVLGARRSRRLQDVGIGYMALTSPQELAETVEEHTLVPYRGEQVALSPYQRTSVLARAVPAITTFGPAPQGGDGSPAITFSSYYRGRSLTFAGSIGKQYYRYQVPELGQFIAGAVRWASSQRFRVTVSNAPSIVGVNAWRRQDGALLVFLVNYNTTTSSSAPSLVPVHNIRVSVQWGEDAPGIRVSSVLSGEHLPHVTRGTEIAAQLPTLNVLDILAFAPGSEA